MAKDLKAKAINIKGKKYVLVSDRVIYFNENYPHGSITTELLTQPTGDIVVVKATVVPDETEPSLRTFTGHSQAVVGDGMVNKTAALENAETSAVGRALGMMGIGVLESIASADEMNKAIGSTGGKKATEKQIKWMRDTARELNDQLGDDDEVDEFLAEVLTMPPQDVPVYKVGDAVKAIKEWNDNIVNDLIAKHSDLSQEDLDTLREGMDDGSIPY